MKTILFLIIFLLIGAFFIVSNENLHLNKSDEMNKFFGLYYGWFAKLFENAKSVTSYVVNVDWVP